MRRALPGRRRSRRRSVSASVSSAQDPWREILERVRDGVVALDRDWRFTYANVHAGEIMGRRPEDLVGKHIWTEFPEAVGGPFHQAYERALATQQPQVLASCYEPWARWFENRIYPSPEGLTIYLNEITERKQAEGAQQLAAAALDRERKHLDLAQARARLGSWERDLAEGSGYWSAQMYELLRRDPGLGPPGQEESLEAVHPEDRERMVELARAAAGGVSQTLLVRTNPERGPLRHLEVRLERLSDAPHRLLGTLQDVSEREDLLAREKRSREVAESLRDAYLALAVSADREAVLESLLDHLAGLVPYDSANVMLLQGDRLAVWAARGYERWTDAGATRALAFDVRENALLAEILDTRRSRLVADVGGEPRWQRVPGAEHVRSWIGVPLVSRGEPIGLFSIDRTEPNGFTPAQVRLAEALAPAAAAAIKIAQVLNTVIESEERLRLALDAAHLGTFDWDVPANRITWSRWHEELWGMTPGEFGGTYEAFAQRVHPEDLPAVNAEVQRCLTAREPFACEFRVVWPDGSVHWVQGRGEFSFDAGGRAFRMRGAVLETTARRQAEESLRDSEARVRRIFEQASDGIFVIDTANRYVDANAAGQEMFGYSREELLALNVADVVAPHERPRLLVEPAEMLAGKPHLSEWLHLRKDGTTFPAEVAARRLNEQSYLAIVRDLTERKRLEEQVRRGRQMAALGALVAGVAHEIRNPLFAMSSTLEAFAERFEGSQAQHLAVLRRELQRLNRLAQDLLDYGRPPQLDLEAVALRDVIAAAAAECVPTAAARNVRVTPAVPDDLPAVSADRGRLQQVLQNVVDNAVRHSPPGAAVVVSAAVEEAPRGGPWLRCSVLDDGPGFPPESLQRVGEPFFTRRRGGSGLGLAVARRLAEMHGGTIEAANRREGGAVVTIRVPVHGPEA